MSQRKTHDIQRRDWTQADRKMLVEMYPTATKQEMLAVWQDRTWDQIRNRAIALGAKRKIGIVPPLRDVCADCGSVDRIVRSNVMKHCYCKPCYDRRYNALRRRGAEKPRDDFWREDELEVLRRLYPCGAYSEICAALPNRTINTIKQRAHKLGLHRLQVASAILSGEAKEEYLGDDGDRSLAELQRQAESRPVPRRILPEIAELCQAERRILQQLDALRQHQQQEQAHVKRSLSNRETV